MLPESTRFHVVDTSCVPILGLRSCLDFQLIKIVMSVTAENSVHVNNEHVLDVKQVKSEFADVFHGIGLVSDECKIHLKSDAVPVVNPPRKVPIALRDKLKSELDRMEKSDVIAKVATPTEWVNSLVVVEKPNGKLRVCLDPLHLNQAIQRPHYPMRTLDDILPQLSGATVFTKLDARSGYWTIKLEEESSFLTTFNTPFGRYRFKRLPFGLKSAQDEFQHKMDQCLEGIDGVVNLIDDILVYGKTRAEHDRNLRNVLSRLREKNIKLNDEKLSVGVSEVTYFGHLLTSEGLKPDPSKIDAIRRMEPPKNRSELETFLGMVNYMAKFAPHLSEITSPMRALLGRGIEFVWDSSQQQAFDKVIDLITQSPGQVLRYYDPKLPLTLQVDASKFGLGATLLQEDRPVAYASKALTPAEVQYAQIEKEMLAILFGCKRFHQYVYGQHVIVQSDHKPLESIMKKSITTAPARLQRMMLSLQRYDISVVHIRGKDIPVADTLSRKFVPETDPSLSKDIEYHVHSVMSHLNFSDVRLSEIQQAYEGEPQCSTLIRTIRDGWPESRKDCPPNISAYWNYRDELTVCNGLIMKGHKVVIPPRLQSVMLERVHVGHMGIEKTTKRARDIMFWPSMSAHIAEMIQDCDVCLERRYSNPKEPLTQHKVPLYPWQVVGSDLFTWDGQDYVVVVDYYSRYFEVGKLKGTRACHVIAEMKKFFSTHGIPETVISDNGPQYASEEFRDFARSYGFAHQTSSPHFPQSNGLAEKTVQTCKHIFDKAKANGDDPYLGILEYKVSPVEGQLSPSQLLMSRRLRTLLPTSPAMLRPKVVSYKKFDTLRTSSREKQKLYHDVSSRELKPLKVGETVRVKFRNGLWKPVSVIKVVDARSYLVATPDGTVYRRNRRHLLKTYESQKFIKTDLSEAKLFAKPSVDVHVDKSVPGQGHISDNESFDQSDQSDRNISPPMNVKISKSAPSVTQPQPYITRSGRVVKPKILLQCNLYLFDS